MNQEMFKLCQRVLELAKQNGADECKVVLAKAQNVEISYREQKPETIKQASTQRLALEIYVQKRYSHQTTSDLRMKSLQEFIERSIANTKLLAQDPLRCLPDPACYRDRPAKDLKIMDSGHGRLSAAKRHALVKEVEGACLAEGGARAVSVTASLQDQFLETMIMTSNGLEGFEAGTSYLAAASMSVRDEGSRRPRNYYYHNSRLFSGLGSAQEIGRLAAQRSLGMIGASKIPTATLPVIVENISAGRILRGLLAAMTAYAVQQKQSFLAGKKGQKIGGDLLTLIDDPLLVSGLDSRLFDDEGFAACKRILFEGGVLKEFYIDWYYGKKLGWEPTGGSPSNLILPAGQRSPEQIMRDLGRGVFVTEFIGGNSNSTTGDFSFGIGGFLFENGAPSQPIAEMNLADNHLMFWNKLVEVANDPWTQSSWRVPSLVFRDVVVSGV